MAGAPANKPKKKVTFQSPETSDASPVEDDQMNAAETTDQESTRAVAGSDDEQSQRSSGTKSKMSTTDDSSDAPGWTREEDRTICVMKSENNTWADIGKVIRRTKKEVQKHYKELVENADKIGITADKLAEIYIDENKSKAKKSKTKGKDSNGDKRSKSKAKDNGKDKEKAKSKGKSERTKKDYSKSKSNGKSKKKPVVISSDSSSSASSSASDAGTESSEAEDNKSAAAAEEDEADSDIDEHTAQQRYLYERVWSDMYPDQKRLKPDQFYSASDCRILATIEARYRALKWQHLQSDFCNATGRMVDAMLLQAKFEEE